ncbi:MAG: hypothetical protein LH606_11650, partial [Cytophagaceae bacterium]|nr:hypothetical protein [Cytophagaceae bacterium]
MKTLRILTALAFAVLVLATGALAQTKKKGKPTKPKVTTQKKVVPQAEVETPVEIQVQAPATQPAPLVQQQQPVPMEDTQVNSQEQTASNTRRA